MKITHTFLLLLFCSPLSLQAGAVETLLDQYQAAGSGPFTAEQGATAWNRTVNDTKSGQTRSCSDCHGKDLTKAGRHAKTGKRIEPMAPSVNSKRLSDAKKIEKWFKRNCKWTWGRVCTAQEKADLLSYLQQL
jgi:cytochrome c553